VELCSGELMYNIEEGIIGKNKKSIKVSTSLNIEKDWS
jgi:hypothetical protein